MRIDVSSQCYEEQRSVCVCGGGGQYFNKACPKEAHKHPLQWESLQPKQTCQFDL